MISKIRIHMKRIASCSLIALSLAVGLAANETPSETIDLFNGRDLDGWQVVVGDSGFVDDQSVFQVVDGAVHVYKDAIDGSEQPFGYLLSEDEYSDYRLSLEYKWGRKKFPPRGGFEDVRDAGVCYHVQAPFVIWPTSAECQIQEGDTGDVWVIKVRATSTVHPEIMNYWPADEGGVKLTKGGGSDEYQRFLRSYCYEQPGWNRVELVIRGDHATYIINGRVANRVSDLKRWDESSSSWQALDRGRILLQAEGAEIFYRNVTLQPLGD